MNQNGWVEFTQQELEFSNTGAKRAWQKCLKRGKTTEKGENVAIFATIFEFELWLGCVDYEIWVEIPEEVSVIGKMLKIKVISYNVLKFGYLEEKAKKLIKKLVKL